MSRPRTEPDPLADLRQEDAPTGLPGQAPTAPPEQPAAPPVEPDADAAEPVHDTAWHQEAATAIVERWHGDMVTRAQMHGGGTCGCRYAANLALVLLYGPPVIVAPEPVEVEAQP